MSCIASGHDCEVVAPSQIPKNAGECIKTDRRDALKPARLLRDGDLMAAWVPDQEQERMRDLSRARGDLKAQERKARQQLNGFLLRYGRIVACNPGKHNDKRRGQSGVGYVKKNFVNGLDIFDFSALNPAARVWLDTIANVRVHGETHQRPVDQSADERSALRAGFVRSALESRRGTRRRRHRVSL